MKRVQKLFVFAYLIFLLGLRLSGSLSSPLSTIFYVLSYLLPAVLLFRLAGGGKEAFSVCPPRIGGRTLLLTLPLFARRCFCSSAFLP